MTSRNKCTFLVFILVTTWEDVWHNEGYMYSIHTICFLLSCVVQTVLTVIVLRRQQQCILLTTVNVNTATMLTFHLCAWAILKCLPAFQPCSWPPVWRVFFFSNGAKLTLEYARSCTRGSASLSPFKDGPPSKQGYVRCKNSLRLITPARNRFLTSVCGAKELRVNSTNASPLTLCLFCLMDNIKRSRSSFCAVLGQTMRVTEAAAVGNYLYAESDTSGSLRLSSALLEE